jgi:hypothetical protein
MTTGCWMCTKRRIQCDRSLPGCKKCGVRRLQCSGYGRKLKWCRGVASRGKLAGKTFPTNALVFTEAHDEIINAQFAIDFTLSPSPYPGLLKETSVRRLIHYYDNAIAATRVWVDSPDNSWRNIIIPLAMKSPLLLNSVLALAAEHMCARLPSSGLQSSFQPGKYRRKSLKLLSQALSSELKGEPFTAKTSLQRHHDSANEILAALLVLCSLEMVQSSLTLWRLHLRAARIMIQRWLPSNQLNSTTQFLIQEAFAFDVFASTTIVLEPDPLPNNMLSLVDNRAIFIDYLRLLQAVTATERHRAADILRGAPVGPIDILDFVTRFDKTRTRTLRLSRHLPFAPPSLRQGFAHVVEIYHYAGLIYTYQSLLPFSENRQHILHCLPNLFASLVPIADSAFLAQDLVWPLFIAGTESHGNALRQAWLKDKMENAMRNTGYSMCIRALDFLDRFWSARDGARTTWVEFARKNDEGNDGFMAFA